MSQGRTNKQQAPRFSGPRKLEGAFRSVRRKLRLVIASHAILVVLAGVLCGIFALGMLDYLLRLPSEARIVLWVGGLVAISAAIARIVLPAIHFRPSLDDVATRVESSLHGNDRRGLLAAGLAFERASDGGLEGAFEDRVREHAASEVKASRLKRTVQLEPLGGPAGLVAAVCTLVALVGLMAPESLGIGARRVLTPWDNAAWPKLAEISDTTEPGVRAIGSTTELRAELLRAPVDAGRSRVVAYQRWIVEGRELDLVRTRMMPSPDDPNVYTVEVTTPTDALDTSRAELEYWFTAHDAQSEEANVPFEPRPKVQRVSVNVTPPQYASEAISALGQHASGETSWRGDATTARMRPDSMLAGSSVEITIETNKSASPAEPIEDAFGLLLDDVTLEANADESRIVVRGFAQSSGAVSLTLIDSVGLRSAAATQLSFDVSMDLSPAPSVALPERDEEVLVTATLPIAGEARDDVALTALWMEAVTLRVPAQSQGAPIQPTGDPIEIARTEIGAAELTSRTDAEVSIAELGLTPGDELWLTTLATDAEPSRAAPATSRVRKVRVIGEDRFVEQLWGELESVRESAVRADELQAELQRRMSEGDPSDPIDRALADEQSRLRDQIAGQQDRIERLAERIERNALDDENLENVVDSARETAGVAQTAAERAAGELRQSAERNEQAEQNGEDPAETLAEENDQTRREVEENQSEVRDELGELISLLDREGDGYLTRRNLERLAEQQRRLAEQTERIGQQTSGQTPEQLEPEQLRELDRIAQRQQELAEAAREALDDLSRRAREMQQADPAQSAAMRQAAERGRQAEIEQQLQQAAEQIGQNQTSNAQQNQEAALEALEEMLEDLGNADRNRNEQLRRVLASVVESLETLIRQQRNALTDLEAVREDTQIAALADGMIAIQRNTLGVFDLVASQGEDLAEVVPPLNEALDAQEDAIVSLRGTPPARDGAIASEEASLDALIRAKDIAQELQEAAEEDAKREARRELRRAYRELLELQVAVRAEIVPLEGQPIGRRERRDLLQLSTRQESINDRMSTLLDETEELPDAIVFRLAHERFADVGGTAIERLREPPIERPAIRSQDTLVNLLRSLVDALREGDSDEEDFREQEQDQQGGGGGQGSQQDQPLVPPLAQLKLLRAMQDEAYNLTRELDAAGSDQAAEVEGLVDLQRDLADYGQDLLDSIAEQQNGNEASPGEESPE